MCATFFSLCQWQGGAKSGASAQHCVNLSLSVLYLIVWPQTTSVSSNLGILIIREVAIFKDFYAKFGSKMAPKWRKLVPFFRANATASLFFNLVLPQRAQPFLVYASGAVALKVAQVPSTVQYTKLKTYRYTFKKK